MGHPETGASSCELQHTSASLQGSLSCHPTCPVSKDSLLLPVNSAQHLLSPPGLGFVVDAHLPPLPCVALSFLRFHNLPSSLATMASRSYFCNLHMMRLPASSFPSHSYNLCRNIFLKHIHYCLFPYLRLSHESSVPSGPNELAQQTTQMSAWPPASSPAIVPLDSGVQPHFPSQSFQSWSRVLLTWDRSLLLTVFEMLSQLTAYLFSSNPYSVTRNLFGRFLPSKALPASLPPQTQQPLILVRAFLGIPRRHLCPPKVSIIKTGSTRLSLPLAYLWAFYCHKVTPYTHPQVIIV